MEKSKYVFDRHTWNSGLFGILDDLEVCVKGTLCPFYLAGRTKADVEGRPMNFLDMLCCPSEYQVRQQIRSRFNLGYSPWYDCCVNFWCWQCMICQDQREVKLRVTAMCAQYRPTTLEME
eukprot:TRINITY_DN12274_c0_g1_i1.p1 TRINITY_DN12274_c0_g1~~TRINITY_DN12274_c0_g1_i1.p1  ORF type:complete len:120 (+),score=26.79 TRINITY_DN12274_c0_g1_i1:127-486(+)